MTAYTTIAVDPPWPQKGAGPLKGGHGEGFVGTQGSLAMPYATMALEQIEALPVAAVVAPDAHLFLWTTSGFLRAAFGVLDAWGFRYSTTLVWPKAPIGNGLGGTFGIATEFVLYARLGRPETTGRIGRNWWQWKRPYNAQGKPMHSAKPPEFYDTVAGVCPGPRLEMFARRAREGWDAWGDQAPGAVALPVLDGVA